MVVHVAAIVTVKYCTPADLGVTDHPHTTFGRSRGCFSGPSGSTSNVFELNVASPKGASNPGPKASLNVTPGVPTAVVPLAVAAAPSIAKVPSANKMIICLEA